ncbi:MAG TPA: class I SAM-dependent methyltransferase [Candidatus Paceibacterota bacterium]
MIKKCVWCGKTGMMKLHARVRWEDLDSSWYRCATCASLMILPRPSAKLITKVYEDNYRKKRLQPHAQVDNRIRYSKEYRPTVFGEYEKSLEDLKINKSKIKSVLDFGCADGIFLEFCRDYFDKKTDLVGTDLSNEMLADARTNGFNVVALNDLKNLNKQYDLITLWDVIEHVEEPEEIITQLAKLLSKNGKIVIQTPRFGVLAELLGENWSHLLPVQHLSLASKEGMGKLAKRLRLTINKHTSFSANAPGSAVAQPYKSVFDQLAKRLDFGGVQLLSMTKR